MLKCTCSAKDSANFQNCTMEALLLKEFRDLRSLFEKEVVSKVKEPLVWQIGNESDSFGLWILLIPGFWYRHIDVLLSSCSLQRYYYYVYSFFMHMYRLLYQNTPTCHLDQEHSLTTHEFRARAFCIVSLNFLWLLFFCRCFLSLTTFHALHGQKEVLGQGLHLRICQLRFWTYFITLYVGTSQGVASGSSDWWLNQPRC